MGDSPGFIDILRALTKTGKRNSDQCLVLALSQRLKMVQFSVQSFWIYLKHSEKMIFFCQRPSELQFQGLNGNKSLLVFDKLVAEGILKHVEVPDSALSPLAEPSGAEASPAAGVSLVKQDDATVDDSKFPSTAAGLSLFQPFSPPSERSSALETARLKVHLALVEAESWEREQIREHEFHLAVKRLEVEDDKEACLPQLELEKGLPPKEMGQSGATGTGMASVTHPSPKAKLDITKVIPILSSVSPK